MKAPPPESPLFHPSSSGTPRSFLNIADIALIPGDGAPLAPWTLDRPRALPGIPGFAVKSGLPSSQPKLSMQMLAIALIDMAACVADQK